MLVCFGKEIWIKIKEIVRESCEEKKNDRRGKKEKVNSNNKTVEIPQVNGSKAGSFLLDGIRVNPWWEKESWAMVPDHENPFGDLEGVGKRDIRYVLVEPKMSQKRRNRDLLYFCSPAKGHCHNESTSSTAQRNHERLTKGSNA